MAYPPAYERSFSFTDWETANPGQPKPGASLDTEFDDVSNALTATQNTLKLIQRADGQLANDSVGEDQLQDGLLDGIVDGITADAEAAADAAAASASAAAGSAAAANSSASAAATSAATASGAAAAAGTSQGIAQGAADDANSFAVLASGSAGDAQTAANSVLNSVAEAQLHEETAFKWAEYLTGPILPAPPGWPEAVDDGMFSSKWWAIRARDYNSTSTIDLGPGGEPDIGDAFDIWDAIAGNDLGVGQTYATWGTPTQTYVLIDRSNPSDPNSWLNITGGPGPPGPANTLTVGTIATGSPGTPVTVILTGTSPNQVLNMTIPQGDTGPQGPQGIQGPPGTAANLADPSALIGLTPINGTSPNAIRSDAAPALSQAIVPTWTGKHTFSNNDGAITLSSSNPRQYFNATGGVANGRLWFVDAINANWRLETVDDAVTVGKVAIDVARSGNAVSTITFGNSTDNPTYTFAGTGLTTHNGSVQVQSGGDHIGIANTDIYYEWRETDEGTDRKIWWARVVGGSWILQTRADSLAAGMNALAFVRTGTTVDQMLVGPNGTAAAPAISFTNDANTGIRLGASDDIRLVAGGADAIRVVGGSSMTVRMITGQFGLQDGTGLAPALSFESDPDTGVYLVSPNQLGLTTGGSVRIAVSTTSLTANIPFRLPDGTAAAPAFSFDNDNDTGLYREASDFLTVTSGGTPIASFLGIGATTLPRLYMRTRISIVDGDTTYPGIFFEADTNTGIYRRTADEVTILAGGSPIAYFSGAGRYLQVDGNIYAYGSGKQILGDDGSSSLPSHSFYNDTDTGIYRTGTNFLAITCGNTKVAEFQVNNVYSVQLSPTTGQTGTGVSVGGGSVGVQIGSSGAGYGAIGCNVRFTSTAATFQYASNDSAALMDFHNGSFRFWRAPSGTSGATISFTNIAIIDSTGVTALGFQVMSSRTLKRETGRIRRAADVLSRLRPILYRLLADESDEQLGLIAEEVHEVCPQLSDGKSVKYDRLALLLLADWQEQRAAA